MGRWRFRLAIAIAVAITGVLSFGCFSQAQQSGWWGWLALWLVPAIVFGLAAIALLLVEVGSFLPDPLPTEELRRNPARRGLLTSNEVRITARSTSYQLYKRYHVLKGDWYRANPTPNFCQFFWTISVGLPVMWFLKAKLIKSVEPVWCTLLLGVVAGLAAVSYFWPGKTLEVAAIVITGVAALIFVIWASDPFESWFKRTPDWVWKRRGRNVLFLLTPLWFLPVAIVVGAISFVGGPIIIFNEDLVEPHGKNWVHWFFRTRKGIVTPWLPYLLAIIAAEWWYFGTSLQLWLGQWLLIGAVLIGVLLGLIVGLIFAIDKLMQVKQAIAPNLHLPKPSPGVKIEVDRGSSMWRLFWVRLKAEKRKVCPLIVLPEE